MFCFFFFGLSVFCRNFFGMFWNVSFFSRNVLDFFVFFGENLLEFCFVEFLRILRQCNISNILGFFCLLEN